VLQAIVNGLCLYRAEHWHIKQLMDEPKLVFQVGFIRENGKAKARTMQQSPETCSSLLR
jgi:hypothetical protein